MQIFLSSKAERQLFKLPRQMHDLIASRIKRLAQDPFGPQSKKLKDWDGWRYRVGDYRVIYTVEGKKLIILSIGHKKEIYKLSLRT